MNEQELRIMCAQLAANTTPPETHPDYVLDYAERLYQFCISGADAPPRERKAA